MFRKLVSTVSFSPALVGQLAFYAKRLRKEEATRRAGLIFTALALVIQSFAVFAGPEAVNASSPGDLVTGGINTKSQLMTAWDNNTQGFRDLLKHAGINDRSTLSNLKEGHINSRTNSKDNGWLTWNRVSKGGAKYNESAMKVGDQTIFVRSLAAFDVKNTTGSGSWYPAFVGKNSNGEEFAIMKGCANITMKKRPVSDPDIKVCDLTTKKIITIRQSQFNNSKHSKNINDCTVPEREISLCEIATGKIISIKESQFNSLKHSKNLSDCDPKPIPTASCNNLVIKKISRTEVELQASAKATDGASIRSYTFIIKDKDGKEVLRRTISSTNSPYTLKYELETDGKYTAEVIIGTSVGNQQSNNCKGSFTIDPIPPCPLNPNITVDNPECQPCIGDPTLWVKDENCVAKVVRKKEAINMTSNVAADSTVAKASDRIKYSLTVTNEGKDSATVTIEDELADMLEYATILDNGGGSLDKDTKVLSWKDVSLEPGESKTRMFTAQLASSIPAASQGASDPSSYDCRIINTFGNAIEIDVDCPPQKVVEQTVRQLPTTGPTENLMFAGIVFSIVAFFYARSRQLGTEVRLIRRDLNTGNI